MWKCTWEIMTDHCAKFHADRYTFWYTCWREILTRQTNKAPNYIPCYTTFLGHSVYIGIPGRLLYHSSVDRYAPYLVTHPGLTKITISAVNFRKSPIYRCHSRNTGNIKVVLKACQ